MTYATCAAGADAGGLYKVYCIATEQSGYGIPTCPRYQAPPMACGLLPLYILVSGTTDAYMAYDSLSYAM